MSYTEVFGGETVNPTQLSYIAYESDLDLSLVWPIEAPPSADVAADKIDVNMGSAALTVFMPPANQVSVGQDVLIRNTGTETFFVKDYQERELGSVASGEAWYFVVIDNATEGGAWYAIEFGAGTSSATAASLAGAGLRAQSNLLDQNLPTTSLLGNYAVTINDRATVLQSAGGALVWTFASAATLGDGWFAYVINAGSGSVTLTPAGGQTIDAGSTKVIAPTESLIVFSDGVNLHSLGYGRSIVNTVTGASINAAGTGTLTLNSAQIAAQVQDFNGTLTGNRIVEYGSGIGYWFVFNNTTGAFSLTLRTDVLDPGAVIAQGSYSIVRNNGTNMDVAFTATSGTVSQVNTGTGLSGGPITTTGTIILANTAVTPGAYGSASQTLTETVDAQGRLTAAAAISIAIASSQVTDLAATITAAVAAYDLAVVNPVASVKPWALSAAPTGWLLMSGRTIGNASSNGTARANADTATLFAALWGDYANTILPIFDSAGIATTRGANAAADFAANKALTILDARGRVWVGRNDMGGTSSGRMTTTMTPDGNTLGAVGGAQTQTLITANLPAHNHVINIIDPGHTHTVDDSASPAPTQPTQGGGASVNANDTGSSTTGITATSDNTGSGTAFDKTQPGMIGNWIIRYA